MIKEALGTELKPVHELCFTMGLNCSYQDNFITCDSHNYFCNNFDTIVGNAQEVVKGHTFALGLLFAVYGDLIQFQGFNLVSGI